MYDSVIKPGYYISFITAILAIITLGIAVSTPPLSGPFCRADCFEYPYNDIISRFPRDYLWMFPAIILSLLYMVMMISIHNAVPENKRFFSQTGVAFSIISALILSLNYFVQVSFIQPSLLAGETQGIAVLSQYNPHGIFIILEELGFIAMNISFLCLVPVFSGKNKPERAIRLTFLVSFILMVISFFAIVLIHGHNREYRFEVFIISIDWIELIIAGFLFSAYFKRLNKGIA